MRGESLWQDTTRSPVHEWHARVIATYLLDAASRLALGGSDWGAGPTLLSIHRPTSLACGGSTIYLISSNFP